MSVSNHGSWVIGIPPRSWQSEALSAWCRELRGIVAVVTGGGKTTFSQMCMQVFREQYVEGKFVIVVPTLALLDQWYVSLREDLRVPDQDISLFSGESRPKDFNVVNLMVINTARTLAPLVSENGPCMLIVDECHRAASEANSLALLGKPTATLGLSATPEREYDDLFNTVLVPALGPVVFRYNYNQALEDSVIVPFDLINVAAEMTPDEQSEYDRATRDISRTFRSYKTGNTSWESLSVKLQRRARIAASSIQRIPVTIRLAEQERSGRIMVFHETVSAAESILRILQARFFNATIYHSKVGPVLRRDNLRLYRNGVFNALVTCRALDEGVNVPETNVAIIASSTASQRQRIQRLGRVLRPAPGKERAKVFTIYTTKSEEVRLFKETQNLLGASEISWMRAFS